MCGNQALIQRHCAFPTADYPFLCTGMSGTPGTYANRLESMTNIYGATQSTTITFFFAITALSYNSILQGANLRWTLFVHCWRAKTPQDPNSEEIATSFNVFNLDPVFTPEDRTLVIDELKKRGFNTDPSNLIEFDYSTTDCS